MKKWLLSISFSIALLLSTPTLAEDEAATYEEPVVTLATDSGNRYTKAAYALALFAAAEYMRADSLAEFPDKKLAAKELKQIALTRIANADKILKISLDPKWYAESLKRNLETGNAKLSYGFFGIQTEEDGLIDGIDIDEAFAEIVALGSLSPSVQRDVKRKIESKQDIYQILGDPEILDLKPAELEEMATGKIVNLQDLKSSELPDLDIFEMK